MPNFSTEVSQKIILSIKYFGLGLTAIGIVIRILPILRRSRKASDWYKRSTSKRLDKNLGVETAGIITQDELDISNGPKQQALWYQPIASITFGLVLSRLKINYSDYIFIDYGSGKGRALFLAAQLPFKRIIGIELSRKLHQFCEENIRRFYAKRAKCPKILSVCEDAAIFELPQEPSVIYFFQPFHKEVFKLVIDNIRRSVERSPRHLIILYYHPVFENFIGEPTFLRKIDFGIKTVGWDFYETLT